MDRSSETATGLDTICEALVRLGKPDTAMALYRQAFPDRKQHMEFVDWWNKQLCGQMKTWEYGKVTMRKGSPLSHS